MEDKQDEQRLRRLRAQMREQDKQRHQAPDADELKISIVYVWRAEQWIPITWFRSRGGKVSTAKMRYLRQRYARRRSRATRGRIGRREIMAVMWLHLARITGGPQGAPQTTLVAPIAKRGTGRVLYESSRLKSAFTGPSRTIQETTNPGARLTRTSGRLGRCDYASKGTQCRHRAFWLVSYMDDRKQFGYKRTLKKRCTKHAWNEKYLPSTARQIMCVQRTPRKAKAKARKAA